MTFPLILGIMQIVGALLLTLIFIWTNNKMGKKWDHTQLGLIIFMVCFGLLLIIFSYIIRYAIVLK
jgi:hypothetical protein